MQLTVGRVYRAKKPAPAGTGLAHYFNDRRVVSLTGSFVEYESPAITNGRRPPVASREAFEAWACRDVTDQLPKGEWQQWSGEE